MRGDNSPHLIPEVNLFHTYHRIPKSSVSLASNFFLHSESKRVLSCGDVPVSIELINHDP